MTFEPVRERSNSTRMREISSLRRCRGESLKPPATPGAPTVYPPLQTAQRADLQRPG